MPVQIFQWKGALQPQGNCAAHSYEPGCSAYHSTVSCAWHVRLHAGAQETLRHQQGGRVQRRQQRHSLDHTPQLPPSPSDSLTHTETHSFIPQHSLCPSPLRHSPSLSHMDNSILSSLADADAPSVPLRAPPAFSPPAEEEEEKEALEPARWRNSEDLQVGRQAGKKPKHGKL